MSADGKDTKTEIRMKVNNGQLQLVDESENVSFKSEIWKSFFRVYDGDYALDFVCCKNCTFVYPYSSRTGTSGIAKHKCKDDSTLSNSAKLRRHKETVEAYLVTDYGMDHSQSISMHIVNDGDIDGVQSSVAESSEHVERLESGELGKAEDDGVSTAFNGISPNVANTSGGPTVVRTMGSAGRGRRGQPPGRRLLRHSTAITTPRPPVRSRCTICNVDFNNVGLAMMHRSTHGPGGKFHCSQCGAILTNVYEFWAHTYNSGCA